MKHCISDLHLFEQRPDLVALFDHYMDHIAPNAKQLYILGDFVEAWIGDDLSTPLIEHIRQKLQRYTENNRELYLFHGNRDFLLGEKFAQSVNAKLIKDKLLITHLGATYLLSHGDEYCTDDTAYQQFKAMVRNSTWQKNFLARSLQERIAIAQQMRDQSKQNQQSMASNDIMDVNEGAVLQALQHADHLIHGHTHRPKTHNYKIGQADKTRIVLSDWGEKGQYLQLDDSGVKSIYFTLASA